MKRLGAPSGPIGMSAQRGGAKGTLHILTRHVGIIGHESQREQCVCAPWCQQKHAPRPHRHRYRVAGHPPTTNELRRPGQRHGASRSSTWDKKNRARVLLPIARPLVARVEKHRSGLGTAQVVPYQRCREPKDAHSEGDDEVRSHAHLVHFVGDSDALQKTCLEVVPGLRPRLCQREMNRMPGKLKKKCSPLSMERGSAKLRSRQYLVAVFLQTTPMSCLQHRERHPVP